MDIFVYVSLTIKDIPVNLQCVVSVINSSIEISEIYVEKDANFLYIDIGSSLTIN